jgi:hypothetical protein
MDEQKELNKALNLGLFSLVGAIIPLIGLILAIVAASLASNVATNKHTKGKKKTVQMVATIGVILSLLAGFGYYSYYKNQQNQAAADERARTEQVQKAAQDASAAKASQQFNLDLCLGQADTAYNQYLETNTSRTTTDASGEKIYYLQQPQWDYVNNKRTTDKDECYRRYPVQ